MAILEELYYGNIAPCERFAKKSSDYYAISQKLGEMEEKLLSGIDADIRKLYEQIVDKINEQYCIAEKETFIDGFRLGAQIMLETLTEPNKQLLSHP